MAASARSPSGAPLGGPAVPSAVARSQRRSSPSPLRAAPRVLHGGFELMIGCSYSIKDHTKYSDDYLDTESSVS